ncbi:DUF3667 domain-containing protein [Dyella marensis]|uniref:DUF3667 domain-containing protein n=1 Tax=Dyella marensis TaxID=500610 RepID=A0A1I2JF18_9GAMM|nr:MULTISPECIES: DUF3667 domain-containing protein [Dyella]SFF52580.1 Protein of unknown function [Dyella marensis]
MSGKEIVSYEGVHCANCTTPMQGEYCHDCGQSIHTVLKPVHHMFEDTLETFLHVDGRVLHTLPPLVTKPGFLTLEYFSGRRQRYVPPFRLMFVLCLLAFFLTHIAVDVLVSHGKDLAPGVHVDRHQFDDLNTPDEVRHALDEQLASLDQARSTVANVPGADAGLVKAQKELRKQADRRIATLAAEDAPAAGKSAATPAAAASAPVASAPAAASTVASKPAKDEDIEAEDWLAKPTNARISWLPEFMNARLAHAAANLRANVKGLKSSNPEVRDQAIERMKAGIFSALPQTMFVLMPAFALLLKLFYLFKRRLFMEHLIVALHSHAFLFANVLLWVLLALLKAWIAPHAAWAGYLLGWLEFALAIWAPVYLLLMQKRVYRQGWPMTVLKYLMIGWCYTWLLGFALMSALVLGVAH